MKKWDITTVKTTLDGKHKQIEGCVESKTIENLKRSEPKWDKVIRTEAE